MSEQPTRKDEESPPSGQDEEQPADASRKSNRIVILEERDIPFEEERPPNFSPYFAIKVHRAKKRSHMEEPEE